MTDSAVRLWGTPVAHDDGKTEEAHLAMKARMGSGRTEVTSLSVQARSWATPIAHNAKRWAKTRPTQRDLWSEVELWSEEKEASMFPTPAAHNAKADAPGQVRRNSPGLPTIATLWPTPTASAGERASGSDPVRVADRAGGPTLHQAVSSHRPPTTPTGGRAGPGKVDLNPEFVAALMGLPHFWLTP